MILRKVDISDFRSHEHTVVEFDEGISVIIGDNGSGKTSILESVNFALFKQKPGVNVDDLIRLGAKGTEVSVTFESGGRVFRATRGRKKGKAFGSSLYRVDDGEKMIATGEDGITKEIEAILGMGGELFTSAVYIKQGEIDTLVSEQAARRKEHVGKLLGADELERAHAGMGEVVKEYSRRVDGLQHLPDAIRETEMSIDEKKKGAKQLAHELKEAAGVSGALAGELEEVQRELEGLEKLRTLGIEQSEKEGRLKSLDDDIEKIEVYEKELKETRKSHEEYLQVENEIKSLGEKKRKLYELQEREKGLENDRRVLEDKISRLEATVDGLFREYSGILGRDFRSLGKLTAHHERSIGALEGRIGKIDRAIDGLAKKISRTEGENIEIEKAAGELEKAGTKCPVCMGPLDKKHKKELQVEYRHSIEANRSSIEKWEAELEGLRMAAEENRGSLRKMRAVNLAYLTSLVEQKAEAEKSAGDIKTGIKSTKSELKEFAGLERGMKRLEDRKAKLGSENERYIAAKSYLRRYLPEKEDFKKEAGEIQKQILKLAGQIKNLGGPLDIRKFNNAKQKEAGLQKRFRDAKIAEGKLESDVAHVKNEIEELKKHLEELRAKEMSREKLARFLVLLEDIRRLFHKDSLQRELRTKALPLIESYTREIFDMFELPYNDLELTDDFGVVLFGPGGEESVDMLSGGERIAAALALRMGIAKALSGSAMELIILDEPTIHLDAQRRLDLVEIIRKLSIIPQTIVVTHDKEFEQAADKLIVVEKVRGISRVS